MENHNDTVAQRQHMTVVLLEEQNLVETRYDAIALRPQSTLAVSKAPTREAIHTNMIRLRPIRL